VKEGEQKLLVYYINMSDRYKFYISQVHVNINSSHGRRAKTAGVLYQYVR